MPGLKCYFRGLTLEEYKRTYIFPVTIARSSKVRFVCRFFLLEDSEVQLLVYEPKILYSYVHKPKVEPPNLPKNTTNLNFKA